MGALPANNLRGAHVDSLYSWPFHQIPIPLPPPLPAGNANKNAGRERCCCCCWPLSLFCIMIQNLRNFCSAIFRLTFDGTGAGRAEPRAHRLPGKAPCRSRISLQQARGPRRRPPRHRPSGVATLRTSHPSLPTLSWRAGQTEEGRWEQHTPKSPVKGNDGEIDRCWWYTDAARSFSFFCGALQCTQQKSHQGARRGRSGDACVRAGARKASCVCVGALSRFYGDERDRLLSWVQ